MSQKDRIFHSRKVQIKNFSVINIMFSSTFWLKKDHVFHPQKIQNKGPLATSKLCSMLKKMFFRFCFSFESWNITFSFLKTSCKLLLSTNFLRWMQSSCLYNNFFFFFIFLSQRLSFNHFKRLKTILVTSENVKLN